MTQARAVSGWFLDRKADMTAEWLVKMNRFDFANLHSRLPQDMPVLVIHGERDAVVPFWMGQEVCERIPSARFIEVGDHPGQVENLAFGHNWYEYFDVRVWHDVIETFLSITKSKARL